MRLNRSKTLRRPGDRLRHSRNHGGDLGSTRGRAHGNRLSRALVLGFELLPGHLGPRTHRPRVALRRSRSCKLHSRCGLRHGRPRAGRVVRQRHLRRNRAAGSAWRDAQEAAKCAGTRVHPLLRSQAPAVARHRTQPLRAGRNRRACALERRRAFPARTNRPGRPRKGDRGRRAVSNHAAQSFEAGRMLLPSCWQRAATADCSAIGSRRTTCEARKPLRFAQRCTLSTWSSCR